MSDETPSISIRAANQEDLQELARLYGLFDDRSLSTGQVSRRLEAAQGLETVFLAFGSWQSNCGDRGAALGSEATIPSSPQEQVLGMASLRIVACLSGDAPHAQVTELYVEKGCQGYGIEQALLAEAETLAGERGAEEITLLTGLRNTPAQSLFHSLGYRDYALTMRKHL